MSDMSDGSGPIQRRTPRTSDGGAPVSGALAIVLAVIAVVAGFLILRSISDNGDNDLGISTDTAGDTNGDQAPQSTAPSSTLSSLPTSTTQAPIIVTGATVIVANANGISGSASSMRTALETGPHFTMGDPTDASAATGVLATSIIYFDSAVPAAQPVADSLNRVLGGDVTVLPLPSGTPPTADGTLNGEVLLMLGTDKANKTLEELNPSAGSGATSVITNPPLNAGTTTG